jgi:hypothetical protein
LLKGDGGGRFMLELALKSYHLLLLELQGYHKRLQLLHQFSVLRCLRPRLLCESLLLFPQLSLKGVYFFVLSLDSRVRRLQLVLQQLQLFLLLQVDHWLMGFNWLLLLFQLNLKLNDLILE